MGAIIALAVIIPVVMLILMISIASKTSQNQQTLELLSEKLKRINDQLFELNKKITDGELTQHKKPEEKKESIPTTAETKPSFTSSEPPVVIKKEEIQKPVPVNEEKKLAVPDPKPVAVTTPVDTSKDFVSKVKQQSSAVKEQGWLQKNPDLEKFIGENLANKIGIAVLVLGIAFFVKYAIDKHWINETGRVAIGLLSGGILIGFAHYFRNTYRPFSSVLAGGGLAVFYFTIAFAYQEYKLIDQQPAFFIMIIITAFAVLLSVLYNRLEIAVLATIGGFITPFLLSNGEDNYTALFTYIAILNSGLMVLAYYKRWLSINFIALFFTILIYGGWLTNKMIFDSVSFPYAISFLSGSIFYLQFVLMNIIHQVGRQKPFKAFDFIILLSINLLYFAAGIVILIHWNNGVYKGLFTASLGIINLALAWLFFKNRAIDKNFIYLLIGLTLTFMSLAAPVQLRGNYITLFWAAETVVLFWLFQRSGILLLKITAPIIAVLMIISLGMDWGQIYINNKEIIPVIANKGLITSLVAATALLLYFRLMYREADTNYIPGLKNKDIRTILLFAGVIILYIAGVLELYYQFNTRLPETRIYTIYIQLYTFLFSLIVIRFYRTAAAAPILRIALTIFSFLVYCYYISAGHLITTDMLTLKTNKAHFLAHWAGAAVLLFLLYDGVIYFRKNIGEWKGYENTFSWLAAAAIIFLLSVEMHYVMMWMNYSSDKNNWTYWENLYQKAGLSILWGVCSFIMMWIGMQKSFKTLRIISLTLFTITIAKLFLYDIRNIPPGGKIAAFILLGVLLLIVSFMYQRLKKIIIDDRKDPV